MNENENETQPTENEIFPEALERAKAELYRELSAKGNAARKGTEKARKHAALISAKGVLARRRKAAERKAAEARQAPNSPLQTF
jgi:hypothetical protein